MGNVAGIAQFLETVGVPGGQGGPQVAQGGGGPVQDFATVMQQTSGETGEPILAQAHAQATEQETSETAAVTVQNTTATAVATEEHGAADAASQKMVAVGAKQGSGNATAAAIRQDVRSSAGVMAGTIAGRLAFNGTTSMLTASSAAKNALTSSSPVVGEGAEKGTNLPQSATTPSPVETTTAATSAANASATRNPLYAASTSFPVQGWTPNAMAVQSSGASAVLKGAAIATSKASHPANGKADSASPATAVLAPSFVAQATVIAPGKDASNVVPVIPSSASPQSATPNADLASSLVAVLPVPPEALAVRPSFGTAAQAVPAQGKVTVSSSNAPPVLASPALFGAASNVVTPAAQNAGQNTGTKPDIQGSAAPTSLTADGTNMVSTFAASGTTASQPPAVLTNQNGVAATSSTLPANSVAAVPAAKTVPRQIVQGTGVGKLSAAASPPAVSKPGDAPQAAAALPATVTGSPAPISSGPAAVAGNMPQVAGVSPRPMPDRSTGVAATEVKAATKTGDALVPASTNGHATVPAASVASSVSANQASHASGSLTTPAPSAQATPAVADTVTTAMTATPVAGLAHAPTTTSSSAMSTNLTSGTAITSQAANAAGGSESLPHTVLNATPNSLEVGVSSGTHGWLKIRAELNGSGQVDASLTGVSSEAAGKLRGDLPALNSYLQSEKVAVGALSVTSAASTSLGTALGSSHGGASGGESASSFSRSSGESATGTASTDAGAGGGRAQQGNAHAGSRATGGVPVVDESELSVTQTSRAGYGGQTELGGGENLPLAGYGTGGGWLNVRV